MKSWEREKLGLKKTFPLIFTLYLIFKSNLILPVGVSMCTMKQIISKLTRTLKEWKSFGIKATENQITSTKNV